MICRGCGAELTRAFVDLGVSPIANDFLTIERVRQSELFLPLQPMTCDKCALVQLPEISTREVLFPENYFYFSSYSTSWLEHSKQFALEITKTLGLDSQDLVMEVASNDGYLLQYFLELGIQVLGVEPSSGVAEVAVSKNIPTVVEFFGEVCGRALAGKGLRPKLISANNVLAHVPDIHDFIEGFAVLIADEGLITFEFPHLVSLIKNNQFDTIYHEHYSYLSLTSLQPIFSSHGLKIIDVKKLGTHGGSLRVYVAKENSLWREQDSVDQILIEESMEDPRDGNVIEFFRSRTLSTKINLIEELIDCKQKGLRIAAYGAAAKGNTLLNYAGIDSDLIEYVVDLNPYKQGKYLPGSRIPVVDEGILLERIPDVLLILPWNLVDEISTQLAYLKSHGVRFLRAIPNLEYF